MNPAKVHRDRLQALTDLPNVGPKIAARLVSLGIQAPEDLRGWDGMELYQALCQWQAERLDPCVLDVCFSITRFMAGEDPQAWWSYTAERKRCFPDV
jgi:hypothetical protein